MITDDKSTLMAVCTLAILLASCSNPGNPQTFGTTGHGAEIELVLHDQYLTGEIVEIKVRNNGNTTYYTDIPDGDCFFNFQVFNSSGKEVMLLNPLIRYDCNLKTVGIKSGRSLLLGRWKQQNYNDCNINRKNSCPKRVGPGLYEIMATLRAGGKEVKIRKTLLIL